MIFLLSLTGSRALGEKPETLADLKLQAERARPEECTRLCADVARRELDVTVGEFVEGRTETAKLALHDVASYAEKATDAAIRTKRREKQLEIELREISHRLANLKRSVSYEDQSAVDTTMEHLEKLRTRILEHMFEKGKK
jgi:hypothetical protein